MQGTHARCRKSIGKTPVPRLESSSHPLHILHTNIHSITHAPQSQIRKSDMHCIQRDSFPLLRSAYYPSLQPCLASTQSSVSSFILSLPLTVSIECSNRDKKGKKRHRATIHVSSTISNRSHAKSASVDRPLHMQNDHPERLNGGGLLGKKATYPYIFKRILSGSRRSRLQFAVPAVKLKRRRPHQR